MRRLRAWTLVAAVALAGCHHRAASHIAGGVLGRVVIYRNGVAFYERNATIEDGKLTVRVPRDRVDDFLKSLTVVDRTSRKPLSVTIPRAQDADGNFLTMTLETPEHRHAQVLLTYVTEAPAWKPSYRVVVGNQGKVMLEGWAVVDNTTSEDWNGVLVGVGASSALAFRYDLWSVRSIDRDLLQGEDKFAIAPPTGVSPYAETAGAEELVSLDPTEVRAPATTNVPTGRTFSGVLGAAAGSQSDTYGTSVSGSSSQESVYLVDGINTTDTGFGSKSGPDATPKANTAGTIAGTLTDKKTGEPLIGATVVATSKALKGEQVMLTDEHGRYTMPNLPPGQYTLTYYYDNSTFTRSNVLVSVGKTAQIAQKLDLKNVSKGEVIEIKGTAPIIDQGSTKTGITITQDYTRNIPIPQRSYESSSSSAKPEPPTKRGDEKLKAIVDRVSKDKRDIVVEVHGAPGTDEHALARGTAVKNKLVDDGVPASKIHIVKKLAPGETEDVRVLAVTGKPKDDAQKTAVDRIPAGDTPVGESHFMADRPMTVRAGSSAMVAMVHGETTGGVVYLYDPISDRGHDRFAFKAVRLDNPTADTLEPGPVTVYGDGRFIGEGITEPVPPHASVVVPFALDKQVVVERNGAEVDQIAKLITVQRGVITAELQHRRDTRFTLTSRLGAPTTVYLRHKLEPGWTLTDKPSDGMKVGDSQLFAVTLQPGETKYVSISEATPVERTFDLATPEALGMMQVFVNDPKGSPQLKEQIETLLATHKTAADLVDKIQTLREQLGEYRSRSGELNAQLVTLKAVKTGGDLMVTLRAKLAEMSERTQKTTIALIEAQEKLMLARVKFQNQLAELKLTDATKKAVSAR
ncbi:MAG TPA: carboxypeptidase regulatory-like domain-containing protein [Kofleriaceae bacterium]|nr:carboxypeptidase regulatory-like domain-containing protein [Kofleriaceae bacterium]